RAEDGEEPGFEPPREPVGARLILLAQKHEGGHEEKEGMAQEPDRAELSLTEKPQPGRRLEDGDGVSRHHCELVAEHRQSREKDESGESERDAPEPVVPGAHPRIRGLDALAEPEAHFLGRARHRGPALGLGAHEQRMRKRRPRDKQEPDRERGHGHPAVDHSSGPAGPRSRVMMTTSTMPASRVSPPASRARTRGFMGAALSGPA